MTSTRITMPGPPPYGESSTWACGSGVVSRGEKQRSSRPAESAALARWRGRRIQSNQSGKSVKTSICTAAQPRRGGRRGPRSAGRARSSSTTASAVKGTSRSPSAPPTSSTSLAGAAMHLGDRAERAGRPGAPRTRPGRARRRCPDRASAGHARPPRRRRSRRSGRAPRRGSSTPCEGEDRALVGAGAARHHQAAGLAPRRAAPPRTAPAGAPPACAPVGRRAHRAPEAVGAADPADDDRRARQPRRAALVDDLEARALAAGVRGRRAGPPAARGRCGRRGRSPGRGPPRRRRAR